MKLAFCLFNYIRYGGLSRDFMRIATECLKRKYIVDVYTISWEGDIPPGINVNLIKVKALSNHGKCLEFSCQIDSLLMSWNYDLVVGFNRMPGLDVYFAADVCFIEKAKQQHPLLHYILPRYKTFIDLERAVFAGRLPAKILVVNPKEIQHYVKYYQTSQDRFYLLPPGIRHSGYSDDERSLIRQKIRTSLQLNEHSRLILFVGSGFKGKGLQRALIAFASLPVAIRDNTYLMVIGYDDVKSWQKMSEKLGIESRVKFIGVSDRVEDFMLAADLLLHPAKTELAGMVLLEALVAGLPVIVTENCGYAFHIKNARAGMIVSLPYQQENLNKELLTYLQDDDHVEFRANALSYAKNTDLYSLATRAVDLLEQFYDEKITPTK